jgi:hypothetical protein
MSIKNFIKNFIVEQDENLVQVSPEEYLETLENVGGVADRISKLKPYKGKGIVITGPLNVSKFKNIGPLTGVVRVMGRMDISGTNVPNVNGITVDGYVSDYGSTMWRIKKQNELNEKLDSLDEKRRMGDWDVENGDDESERTEALYDYLVNNGDVGTYEDDNGEEQTEDKYYIHPYGRGNWGHGMQYEWLGNDEGFNPKVYDVYREDELDDAVKESIQSIIDDVGIDAFSGWVWDDAIDTESWRRWLYEFYSDIINYEPEVYDIPLGLSSTQETQVSQLNSNIEGLRNKIKHDNITDEERNKIIVKIEGLEQIIEDISEDPQGGYDDDEIESKIEDLVDEYVNDIKSFMDEYGHEKTFILDFIDIDKLTDTIISSDGYGSTLNSYDGDYDTKTINGTTYYIMRNS